MRYWRADSFLQLSKAAREAAQNPAWVSYAEYCAQLERGLRKPALAALDRFVGSLEAASFAARREFVSWLLYFADGSEATGSLIPRPLKERIITPTLEEWLKAAPGSSEPHRWLGGYDHLVEALRLDPADHIAHRRFVAFVIGSVRYSGHELPGAYLGDAGADLVLLGEAEIAALKIDDADERRHAQSEINLLQLALKDYLAVR